MHVLGVQVGIGMLLTLKILQWLPSVKPDRERLEKAISGFDEEAWAQNIRRVFPSSAEDILKMEKQARKNAPENRRQRAERVIDAWDDILALISDLPPYEDMAAFMKKLGMPTRPEEIGVDQQDVLDAFICSRDIRDKFILSSMIWDIGYMEECAAWLKGRLDTLI